METVATNFHILCSFWVSLMHFDLQHNILSTTTKQATINLQWPLKWCCNINFWTLSLKLSPIYTGWCSLFNCIRGLHFPLSRFCNNWPLKVSLELSTFMLSRNELFCVTNLSEIPFGPTYTCGNFLPPSLMSSQLLCSIVLIESE